MSDKGQASISFIWRAPLFHVPLVWIDYSEIQQFIVDYANKFTLKISLHLNEPQGKSSPTLVGAVLRRTRPNAICILTAPVQRVKVILKSTINYRCKNALGFTLSLRVYDGVLDLTCIWDINSGLISSVQPNLQCFGRCAS